MRLSRSPVLVGLPIVLCLAACSTPDGRQYELKGQILAVDRDQGTVTVRHEDIKGFMPGMTMPFKVKDKSLMDGRSRGDFVKGTLVVTDTDAYLSRLDVVGRGPVAETAAPVAAVPDILQPGDAVPDAQLVGADGRSFRFSSLRGQVVALTFIYTRCPLPQFCPLLDRQFAAVAGRVRKDRALGASVRLLSISFDPEYDTPVVLAAHGRAVGADGMLWRFATADRATIDAFAPRFGMVVMRETDQSITHNLRTALVDRQGRLLKIYSGNDWSPDDLMADLVRAAGN